MKNIKSYVISAIVALLLIIGVNVVKPQQSGLGGLSERDVQAVSLKVGSSGTKANQLNYGSCQLQPDSATIAASTTARVTCHGGNWSAGQAAFTALTGITSSSKIIASLSSTTAGSTFEGLVLTGVTASTTAGFIEMRISNQTGTTYTWSTSGSASGTAQYIGIK